MLVVVINKINPVVIHMYLRTPPMIATSAKIAATTSSLVDTPPPPSSPPPPSVLGTQ